MKIEKKKINELNAAEYNPRVDLQPEDAEYKKLKKSILEFDYIEPIIWNEKTKNIVGGHQRLKILKDLGYKEVEVSVVKLSKTKEKALNIALNKTGGDWDLPKLKDLLEEIDTGEFDIEITGFDEVEIEDLMTQFYVEEDEEIFKEHYTDKIKTPNYEPTKDKPEICALYDQEKCNELIKRIEESDIPYEEKEFLKIASYRHIVFDYHNIAEYYAHSNKDVQELMEDSALVIIDFNKAIENGFVEFTTNVMDLQDGEDDE